MKIFYLLGKSASGKDTIYRHMKDDPDWRLETATLYTTRPMRDNEEEGVQYHFISEKRVEELENSGRVIEKRVYHTVYGPWSYLTVDDGQFREDGRYLMIGTLESYVKIRDYFGAECMEPIYLRLDDGVRLERALKREREQRVPGYAEMCRRFLADEADFSEDKLQQAGIRKYYDNTDLEACLREIRKLNRHG